VFHDSIIVKDFERAAVPHQAPADSALTGTERMVIELSRRDPASSIAPPNRLLDRLFGRRRPLILSCPRLEALRRYAILYRLRGDALPVDEEERLRAAGYDGPQIGAIACAVRTPRARSLPDQ
jgi:hypothetical protein